VRVLRAAPSLTLAPRCSAPGRVSGTGAGALTMANLHDGLRTQFPYGGLSPRPMYDFPSPTSNYPSGIPAPSPSFFPMAYSISPRFGGSAFIPPADVFGEARTASAGDSGPYTPRAFKNRGSGALASDPVAMHLLVETAMIDSQNFDMLAVEEVDALKQEQKGLDGRLGSLRKRLESETKIRDAARSLTRLGPREVTGHRRGLSSKSGPPVKDISPRGPDELEASNKKVEHLMRELLEVESRMRLIDMQLLMHTAAVLQLTHDGPRKRKQNAGMVNGGDRRPDSPASIYTYENERGFGGAEDGFDERSFYRSPENLDSLMNALQNGTHHRSPSTDQQTQQTQSLTAMSKRLEELNDRLRKLIVEANPERNERYSRPPQATGTTPDASALERQLDFLDQGLRDISADQAARKTSTDANQAMEERLQGINTQIYAMLSASDDNVPPPASVTGGGLQEQLEYLEDSFYSIERLQYALNDQLDDLRADTASREGVEHYESTLMRLWQMIQRGEEEARERKRERRRLLAEDSENTEELSPDESDVGEETFSLLAFDSKIQTIFRRAMSLKDKQSILVRQIKQQRELNSKSDAQREEQVNRLNEQVLSARSEKNTMEAELERAMSQLTAFDQAKVQADDQLLRDVQERNAGLETRIREIQERSTEFEAQVRNAEERNTAYEAQIRDVQERSLGYEAQIQEAQERTVALEKQLQDAQEQARTEAATIQAELAQSVSKIEEASTALVAATAQKEAAEIRTEEAAAALSAKEEELRDLEGEVVRLTTELTFAKAELDSAYGTRAERAAESGSSTKKELHELAAKNATLLAEMTALQKLSEAASQSEQEARDNERNVKAELAGMATEYEELTRDAIQNEKDRDTLEANIDRLRDEKEALELELSDERVKWLGIRSPSVAVGGTMRPDQGATSIRMLREDFRKMMRDRTAEALRALRVSFTIIPWRLASR
jgi:chromosome segregation ATPase